MPGFWREVGKRITRASGWSRTRRTWLQIQPGCAVCGRTSGLHVHHRVPVHKQPSRELDLTNLVTLCPVHHLVHGHLGSWRSHNDMVIADCSTWLQKYKDRP